MLVQVKPIADATLTADAVAPPTERESPLGHAADTRLLLTIAISQENEKGVVQKAQVAGHARNSSSASGADCPIAISNPTLGSVLGGKAGYHKIRHQNEAKRLRWFAYSEKWMNQYTGNLK